MLTRPSRPTEWTMTRSPKHVLTDGSETESLRDPYRARVLRVDHGVRSDVVDWRAWHEDYEDPDSVLGRRLVLVQAQVRAALDRVPPGPVRAISVCAGQGHDLIGVLTAMTTWAGNRRRDALA